MELVECSPEYWEFIRELRNDERVLDGFIENIEITIEMQIKYMVKYQKFYRVAINENYEPMGYVGVINDDMRICTHPDFQKQGVGKFMVNEMMKLFPSAFAKIKIGNLASEKLFESCGFKKKFTIYDTQPI